MAHPHLTHGVDVAFLPLRTQFDLVQRDRVLPVAERNGPARAGSPSSRVVDSSSRLTSAMPAFGVGEARSTASPMGLISLSPSPRQPAARDAKPTASSVACSSPWVLSAPCSPRGGAWRRFSRPCQARPCGPTASPGLTAVASSSAYAASDAPLCAAADSNAVRSPPRPS